jgi:hypothetical protein
METDMAQSTVEFNNLVVTELHYHRNGVGGAGYYAGRAEWKPEDRIFRVMFVAFISTDAECLEAPGHIAILDQDDLDISFRFEDFEADLRKLICSRGGQVMAFPHTLFRYANEVL